MLPMKQLDILGKLFGSATRVKALKFFLLNQDGGFAVSDVATRLRLKDAVVKKELSELAKIGFLKPKVVVLSVVGKRTTKKKKVNGFVANREFALREPLRNLLIESGGMHVPDLAVRFTGTGKISLFVLSGVFLHDADRMIDMMIVGDRLDRKAIDTEVKKIEAEIGKELRYAVFDTEEFMYRLKMYDKLLRDTFDYPHTKIISKIDLPELRS